METIDFLRKKEVVREQSAKNVKKMLLVFI